jgi:hypothetical protein
MPLEGIASWYSYSGFSLDDLLCKENAAHFQAAFSLIY